MTILFSVHYAYQTPNNRAFALFIAFFLYFPGSFCELMQTVFVDAFFVFWYHSDALCVVVSFCSLCVSIRFFNSLHIFLLVFISSLLSTFASRAFLLLLLVVPLLLLKKKHMRTNSNQSLMNGGVVLRDSRFHCHLWMKINICIRCDISFDKPNFCLSSRLSSFSLPYFFCVPCRKTFSLFHFLRALFISSRDLFSRCLSHNTIFKGSKFVPFHYYTTLIVFLFPYSGFFRFFFVHFSFNRLRLPSAGPLFGSNRPIIFDIPKIPLSI